MQNTKDTWTVGSREFTSRLLVGTGKYASLDETREAITESGAEIVTVAIRRTNIGQNAGEASLLDYIPPSKFTYLPNSAGCYTAKDAVRTLRLGRELLDGHNLCKLEVLGDPNNLYPDMEETLIAAKELVADGFDVMVYCSDDPIYARKLEDVGCLAIMPLASLIGSGMGAMELGCAGVLMNTAIAKAQNPVQMARAMRLATQAGREAFLAGRMPKKFYTASPSSPVEGVISSSSK